ncbi:MAG TPA: ArsR family transcriptional regulator [Phycisphaerae bacterium]|nr:ArsR family transcriptional regulator [Phycisphaerae bacterium]
MPHDFAALLGTTRGQVVTFLRGGPRTVNDIAAALSLTDNAVRAHLAELTADGLVEQVGTAPGVRKPHALFELTGRAREHFSRLYVPVLNALLSALDQSLPPETARRILQEAGHALAETHATALQGKPLDERIAYAVNLLRELGAVAGVEREPATEGTSRVMIQGEGCPLSEAVTIHPEICTLVETLLSDVLERPVRERCNKGSRPRCCFHIG